jgi:hypothetical protein
VVLHRAAHEGEAATPGGRVRPAHGTRGRRCAVLAVVGLLGVSTTARAAGPAPTCVPPLALVDTRTPDAVVGDGTPGSCTGAALATAVAAGGIVVFDCGPAPVTIPVAAPLEVTRDTVLDGNDQVTLDGGGTTRILSVPSVFDRGTPTLTVQRLAFVRGRSEVPGGDDTQRGGGAIWVLGGSLHVLDCRFSDDHGPASGQDVAGGAVYVVGRGHAAIVDSTFSGNSASNGGAIGILHADLTLVDSVVEQNAATGSGGNPGNGGNGGGIYVDGVDQTVTLCGVTLQDNQANAFGGGLFRVSNDGVGPMQIDASSVLGNHIPDVSPSLAGGLYLQGVQVRMTASTVAWNQARGAGGIFFGPAGTTIDLTNVTVAENTALSSLAGGIAISSGVTGTIRNATLARNAAPGPVAFAGAATGGDGVTLANSIVDGNEAGNAYNPISCLARFVEGGGNLQWPVARAGGGSDDPGALCSGSVLVAPAELGPLEAQGGPTPTIRPNTGSPAVGRGAGCPAVDQRGVVRDPALCTSGAVEVAPEPGAGSVALAVVAALAARAARRRVIVP